MYPSYHPRSPTQVLEAGGGRPYTGDHDRIAVAGCPDYPQHAEEQRVELTMLLDLPLRAVVFAAQIRAGMWCRNGGSMVDQLMNYRDAPYSKVYYDVDITLLQVHPFETIVVVLFWNRAARLNAPPPSLLFL